MKHLTIIIILFIATLSCKKEEFEINNLNNNKISIIGHGGMGIMKVYPMNSVESITKSLSLGAEGIEIDIQMTKDSILVAFHDMALEHSTDGSGKIYNKNWDEIKDVNYNRNLYTRYNLVKLDDLLKNISDVSNHIFFFDCKNYDTDRSQDYINRFIEAITKIADNYNFKNLFIEIKSESIIKEFVTKRPDIDIFIYNNYEKALDLAVKYNLKGIVLSLDKITKKQVEEAHNHGLFVAVFNSHSKKLNTEAIEKNVDFIQTGKLKHLIRVLK